MITIGMRVRLSADSPVLTVVDVEPSDRTVTVAWRGHGGLTREIDLTEASIERAIHMGAGQ